VTVLEDFPLTSNFSTVTYSDEDVDVASFALIIVSPYVRISSSGQLIPIVCAHCVAVLACGSGVVFTVHICDCFYR
jgi:hypothetical protein